MKIILDVVDKYSLVSITTVDGFFYVFFCLFSDVSIIFRRLA